MPFNLPPEMTIKDALTKSNKMNCLRYACHCVDSGSVSRNGSSMLANRLYEAMMGPWKSLPDLEAVPRDVLHVAKHVALEYLERDARRAYSMIDDADGFVDRHMESNQEARRIYDDVVNSWNDRPNRDGF